MDRNGYPTGSGSADFPAIVANSIINSLYTTKVGNFCLSNSLNTNHAHDRGKSIRQYLY